MKYSTLSDVLAVWQSMQPLSARDYEMLSRRFAIDFNYNSNHIEGNTLTYGQTEILLLFESNADYQCFTKSSSSLNLK